MKGIGSSYPGDHKGSLYSGTNNSDCIGKGDRQLCPSDKGCPPGMKEISSQNGWSVCDKKPFEGIGEGINSGDSYGGYNSKGYPTGSGNCGGHGYNVYYDEDEDRYEYKGEYGVLGRLDVEGVTGHGYTPRTEEAHVYDNYDNLVKIPVSPKRMAVWLNDLKANPGRFETTFYDKKMWSRPSYDPYMKRI